MSVPYYWTYSEWLKETVDKIVRVAATVAEKDREPWLRVQIEAAIRQSFRHGQSGRGVDDPVIP